MSDIFCTNSIYQFNGWLFEFHKFCGPWPLNKDLSVRSTPPGRVFWKMWEEFWAMTLEEKELFKVYQGGCHAF